MMSDEGDRGVKTLRAAAILFILYNLLLGLEGMPRRVHEAASHGESRFEAVAMSLSLPFNAMFLAMMLGRSGKAGWWLVFCLNLAWCAMFLSICFFEQRESFPLFFGAMLALALATLVLLLLTGSRRAVSERVAAETSGR